MDMRAVEPGDNDTYVDLWLKYQKRWQELLPEIPLYSNEYFDICSQYVDGMCTTPFCGYEDIICKLTKTVD
jgi:peptide/nickel transport system substrate-binding protein